MSDSPASPRRRGAPSGNKNAVKHGFYARQFLRSDLHDLEENRIDSLADEIKLIRVYIRRVIDWNVTDPAARPGAEDTRLTFSQSIELLRALSLASICLNRLIRTQQLLTPPANALDELHEALAEMIADMKQQNPASFLPDPGDPSGRIA